MLEISAMPVWKFLHVLGAVLMLGNVIVTGLWAHWAFARAEGDVPAFAARAILKADLCCTFAGGALLVASGIAMSLGLRLDPWATPWLRHGALALALSTGVWLAVLLPDQWRLVRLADAGDQAGLRRVYRRWALLGWAATGLLVWALWAMVAKA
jgi:uncharacterized membrane protein